MSCVRALVGESERSGQATEAAHADSSIAWGIEISLYRAAVNSERMCVVGSSVACVCVRYRDSTTQINQESSPGFGQDVRLQVRCDSSGAS